MSAPHLLGEAIAWFERGIAEMLGERRAADLVAAELTCVQASPGRAIAILARCYHANHGHSVDDELQEVMAQLEPELPSRLTLEQLGSFWAGYHTRRRRAEGPRHPPGGAV